MVVTGLTQTPTKHSHRKGKHIGHCTSDRQTPPQSKLEKDRDFATAILNANHKNLEVNQRIQPG